ncbi:C-type lectin domain family 4 member G-like [Ammospiza caudacuta]|uniref:C-type lectin domain family 4 member G-like n=1 Tax=Ammospiza caudacuta TaxID=2857398 RepID=UPI0027391ED8|nr:C-type lectin domain family 4 member G-like [Ammospiza caudacuta]
MSQQETYGNWLGPRSPQRPPGIYSAFTSWPAPPAPPRPPTPNLGILTRNSAISVTATQNLRIWTQNLGIRTQTLGIWTQTLGIGSGTRGRGRGRFRNGAVLGGHGRFRNRALLAALALLGLAWAGLLGLGAQKYQELRAELELLRGNFSTIWDSVQQDQTRLHFGIRQHQLEQQDLAAQLCRALGSSRPCSPGWLPHRSRCFSFSRDALSWGRAHNACADLGAHLAVVSDEDEQLFLLEHSNRSSSYWLGLTDTEQTGNWRWVTGEEPKFIFWDAWLREEQRGRGGCGALGPQGRWVSAACAEPRGWICQRANWC